eukprot:TRINITY_DN4790_c0_g1_i1.p1 TRINITY_DN4790_c0_g1~~TRINITY_DN4790_c0_g1_i1.p1  ORF type:complete len:152 (-),score=17.11 TRINITY_DN4790_c0_g1_i1:319-774(-)
MARRGREVHFDARDTEIIEFEVVEPSDTDIKNRDEDCEEKNQVEAKAYHLVFIKRVKRSAKQPVQLSADDALERANLLEHTLDNDDHSHLRLRVQRNDRALAWSRLKSKASTPRHGNRDAGRTSAAQGDRGRTHGLLKCAQTSSCFGGQCR